MVQSWGGYPQNLGMVEMFCDDDPRGLFKFSIRLGPYFMTRHNLIDPPLSSNKIALSLSHLVPEILSWSNFSSKCII